MEVTLEIHLFILDPSASDYKKAVEANFPELSIHAVTTENEIGDLIERVDILFASKISDHLIQRASKLKWTQAKTTGVDALVNLPSLSKGVLLTSPHGIHGPQVSEMTILLMLALNRNLPQIIRNQDLKVWERWPGRLLYEKSIGILGVGTIGEEIARTSKIFGMSVLDIDIIRRQVDAVDHFCGPEDLLRVLPELDYFIIVAPLTSQTHKVIGPKALSSMKPSAFLINLGRG